MFYAVGNYSGSNIIQNLIKFFNFEGIFGFLQLSYLLDMLKLNSFDTICHEQP